MASCSNRIEKLNDYVDGTIKVPKQKIEYPNGEFSLLIPIDWEWKVETYENENILLGIDAASKPDDYGFVDIISIQKTKSFGKVTDLKSEFGYYLELLEANWNGVVVEKGETEIFDKKAFFLHKKSNTTGYRGYETIFFILESDTQGVFYNLTAIVSQTKELKKDMSVLIQCLRTFKTNND